MAGRSLSRRLLRFLSRVAGARPDAAESDSDEPAPELAASSGGTGALKQLGPGGEPSIPAEVRHWANPGPDFEEFDPTILAGRSRRAKLLAFYLPQFHSVAENDRWW